MSGKNYHGKRYPQGRTIIPPLCVVMVIPDEGEAYDLNPRLDLKSYVGDKEKKLVKPAKFFQYAWGAVSPQCAVLPEWNGDDIEYQPYPVHIKSTLGGEHTDRSMQLALAILADLLGNDKKALASHLKFYENIVKTLPDLEFLFGDAFLTLHSLAGIGEKP